MIDIIKLFHDTNQIAFEWNDKVWLCQIPFPLKVGELDNEEVMQYVELFIQEYLI